MQRAGGLLMHKSRSGFTLIAAIYLLLFVAVAMSLMLSYTSQSVRQTSDIYLKEQAVQLSRSATEFALLAISGHDRAAGCLDQINALYPDTITPLFDINTTIKYFSQGVIVPCNQLSSTLQTAESEGTVLLDVYVTLRASGTSQMPISYHRRTLQKP